MNKRIEAGTDRRTGLLAAVNTSTVSIAIAASVIGALQGQTSLDLQNQTKNVDFSGAAATRVWKTGTTLPSTCRIGEGFFLTSGQPGLFVCSAQNTWNAAVIPLAGSGTVAQSVSGTFAPNSVPVVDNTGTQVSSGCTAVAGAITCPGGINSGVGPTRITTTEGTTPATPTNGQQIVYVDSSDHSLKSIDGAGVTRRFATIDGVETLTNKTLQNPGLGTSAMSSLFPNDATTGTSVGKLAKLTGSPSAAMITATTDTTGATGIVTGGAGTSGMASIARSGQVNCAFDGATAAGDYVIISSAVAGDCHDAGTTYPVGMQIVGRVLNTGSVAGSYPVDLGPEVRGSSVSSGSSFDPLDYTAAWVRDEMLANTQWSSYADSGGGLGLGDPGFGDPLHPGILQLTTGSISGNLAAMYLAWPNSAQVMHYPAATPWEMRWVAKPWSVSNAAFEVGFQDNGGHNAIKLLFNPSNGGNWTGDVRNNDVDTLVDLGVTASAAWTRFRLRSDTNKIYFSVNDGPEKTICASGCDAVGTSGLAWGSQVWPYAQVRTLTNSWASLGVDFFAEQLQGIQR
jgi:hypothetical protein